MLLEPGAAINLKERNQKRILESFRREAAIHAVAGIGDPERFFRTLEKAGLSIRRHPFSDHHAYRPEEIDLLGPEPVLMTEKDAVKCTSFADERHWYLPVDAVMEKAFVEKLDDLIGGLTDG